MSSISKSVASCPGVPDKIKVVFAFDRVMHYHKETISRLEREMEERGYEFILLSSQDKQGAKGRVAINGRLAKRHEYFRLVERQVQTFTIRYQCGLISKIIKIKPNIMVSLCHSGNISEWLLTLLKKRLGFKLIAWQCGYEFNPSRVKNWILDKYVPRFDHHLAYHTNAKHYATSHGARPEQVTVMHNTINEGLIVIMPKIEARSLLRDKHPSIGDRKIILYVGAVLVEKRIELILQALDVMKRRDTVLVLVGDGVHFPVIRDLCSARDDVVLTGAIVEGVGPYFDAADVYVLPGTGGLGINEAMAHRLPIVSGYADGSADDLVVDGENGYRLRENTAEELADKVSLILDSPEQAERMGNRSRELITGKYAFEKFIERIVTQLDKLA